MKKKLRFVRVITCNVAKDIFIINGLDILSHFRSRTSVIYQNPVYEGNYCDFVIRHPQVNNFCIK